MKSIHVGSTPEFSEPETIQVHFHQFSQLPHKAGESISSSKFSCQGFQWFLSLYPRGENITGPQSTTSSDGEQNVGIYLNIDKAHMSKSKCSIKLTLNTVGKNNQKGSGEMTFEKSAQKSSLGWNSFLSRSSTIKNACINDTLTIQVTMQALIVKDKIWTPAKSLHSDLFRMYQTEELADITFVVGKDGDQTSVRANSTIIMLRAPFMKDLIDIAKCSNNDDVATTTAEDDDDESSSSNTVRIELPDVNPDYFRSMLHFIYCDDESIAENATKPIQLLKVANRFGVWKLKVLLEAKIIREHLNFASSISLLLSADANSCAMLKEAAFDLISRNSTLLMTHPYFPKLGTSIELMKELQEFQLGKPKDGIDDKYAAMPIGELYAAWTEGGVELESDCTREELLKLLRAPS